MKPLTDEELKSLRWFSEHGPTAFLDVTGPPIVIFPTELMRDFLTGLGLLKKEAPNGVYLFSVTDAGLDAIEATTCSVDISRCPSLQEVFMVGEYRADYSGLTEAEIEGGQDPELDDLYRNSVPVNQQG